MQPLPALSVDDVLTVDTSNHANQRGPHGLFRYFGKLAPDVTGAVIDIAASYVGREPSGPLVDVMCGSGTTLIESAERGWKAIGIEVNPVSALYCSVKTTPVSARRVAILREAVLEQALLINAEQAETVFARTRNASRWFTDEARHTVGSLRLAIDAHPSSPERDVLLAALLGRLRRISNASARTGRIFFEPDSADRDIVGGISDSIERIVSVAPAKPMAVEVRLADARNTGLPDDSTNLVFCHPPYFALYRFSADVLRFELEVGGWNRSAIVPTEVREGWKSGDPSKLDDHIADMGEVFSESRRICRSGGVLALVTSNSTLGDQELPVIDRLAHEADHHGWTILKHLERTAHFGSATYHRSARTDKVIQRDHVLVFKAG